MEILNVAPSPPASSPPLAPQLVAGKGTLAAGAVPCAAEPRRGQRRSWEPFRGLKGAVSSRWRAAGRSTPLEAPQRANLRAWGRLGRSLTHSQHRSRFAAGATAGGRKGRKLPNQGPLTPSAGPGIVGGKGGRI